MEHLAFGELLLAIAVSECWSTYLRSIIFGMKLDVCVDMRKILSRGKDRE